MLYIKETTKKKKEKKQVKLLYTRYNEETTFFTAIFSFKKHRKKNNFQNWSRKRLTMLFVSAIMLYMEADRMPKRTAKQSRLRLDKKTGKAHYLITRDVEKNHTVQIDK